MFEPNLFTLEFEGSLYGLHKFKGDAELYLVQRHRLGDWFTVGPANGREITYFEEHGKAVEKRVK